MHPPVFYPRPPNELLGDVFYTTILTQGAKNNLDDLHL